MNKPRFLLSFLHRYWMLLLFLVALEITRHYDAVTYATGPIYYLFELSVGAIACFLLLRNLFMRDTLDKYVQKQKNGTITVESQFAREWAALPPEERVRLSLFVMCLFFIGICIIAASLAK